MVASEYLPLPKTPPKIGRCRIDGLTIDSCGALL
jgi:hypothetical protein